MLHLFMWKGAIEVRLTVIHKPSFPVKNYLKKKSQKQFLKERVRYFN